MSKLNDKTSSKSLKKKENFRPRDNRSFPDVYSKNYYFVDEKNYDNDGYTGC